MKIVAIVGSLRKNSYNKLLLNAVKKYKTDYLDIEEISIGNLPLYNQDFEKNPSEKVLNFVEAIRNSDGVLIITPEYNYSIPGVLKNAIDWASRSFNGKKNAFFEKPVALMSASMGLFGGVRAQYHLRQIFVNLNAFVMNQPEFMLSSAHEKFDQNGELKDEFTIKFINTFNIAFINWIEKFSFVKSNVA